MNCLVEKMLQRPSLKVFTFGDVVNLFPNAGRNAVYAHVQRALKSGELVQIRRGLYHLSPQISHFLISEGVLANLIYGPSYVSFESALGYHGWIPEAVQTCASVTSLRPRRFETVHGLFSYTLIKQTPLMAGVLTGDDGRGSFLVASPLKALADMVASRGLDWSDSRPLVESMRIEPDDLETLTAEDFESLEGVYYSKMARRFLAGLRKDLEV